MQVLIAYFSAEGSTRRVAEEAAALTHADVFEIVPVKPYSKADLNWMNPLSRCNREKMGHKEVAAAGKVADFGSYDFVLLGFPIWYGTAPNVVNTFCRGYDWKGKKLALFATSGGSGMGKTAEKLEPYVRGAEIAGEKLITGTGELQSWLQGLGLC